MKFCFIFQDKSPQQLVYFVVRITFYIVVMMILCAKKNIPIFDIRFLKRGIFCVLIVLSIVREIDQIS